MAASEKLRIDKYLWSIRLFKTRSAAADACDKGRVKMEGTSVKASRNVHVGDTYEVRTDTRKWVIRVESLLDHRVQFSEAVKHYTDLTPPEEQEIPHRQAPQQDRSSDEKGPPRTGRFHGMSSRRCAICRTEGD